MWDEDRLFREKTQWLKQGFLGGAVLCDFLLMQEQKLDFVYDKENSIVQEYTGLLKKRLETEQLSLLLMVNTEMENCYISREEPICSCLPDEIYEHFKNNDDQYPVQAVGLHIDVVEVFIALDEVKTAFHYLRRLQESYEEIFGENSYLFCRNWSYFLNEVLLIYVPDAAIEEFEGYVGLFSSVLKEEGILYQLCINAAIKKEILKREQNAVAKAVALCDSWCDDLPSERKIELQTAVRNLAALHYRYTGEYEAAVSVFEESAELALNDDQRWPVLWQIAYILYIKHDIEGLDGFFAQYQSMIEVSQTTNVNLAQLWNTYGLYHMLKGNYKEAQDCAQKAIQIGRQLCGEDSDLTVLFMNNEASIKLNAGKFDEAYSEIQKLFDLVSGEPEKYPESLPVVLNNMLIMSPKFRVDNKTILKLRHVLKRMRRKHDVVSAIIFKCNLYSLLMASGSYQNEKEIEDLKTELQNYFERYPDSEGFSVYLHGEFCRLCREGNEDGAYQVLNSIRELLSLKNPTVFSTGHVGWFIVNLKIFLYGQEYKKARNWLLSVWDKALFPLFARLSQKNEENSLAFSSRLRLYMSLFISAVRQYPQLEITNAELYAYILNFKYLEDLLYGKPQKFCSALQNFKWLSAKDLYLTKESLIIECFCYTKYDWENPKILLGISDYGHLFQSHYMCFAVSSGLSIISKPQIKLIGERPYGELGQEMAAGFETEQLSVFELRAQELFRTLMDKKERIYICEDTLTMGMPAAVLRRRENCYWGERYQIIYCVTGMDVKREPEIQDFSRSVYFGKSVFENEQTDRRKIQKRFSDLYYARLEVEKLGALTGGAVFLDTEMAVLRSNILEREIIHFATHTAEPTGDDIAQMKWDHTKVAVFSACQTSDELWERIEGNGFRQAARTAGALFSVSTIVEVDDGANAFFMICFYKKLLKYRKISRAFFEAQKTMRSITVREILTDRDYLDIHMDTYLQDFAKEDIPFENPDDWGIYILQMNG